MAVTIKQVAQAAGVSTATVSKVINNKPYISEQTRAHVRRIMEEMDYRPNNQAANFAKGCSKNIIFLAVTETHTAFHNPHMFEIMCGAQAMIHSRNYNFSFIGVPSQAAACHEVSEIVGRKAADGILIHGSATCRPLVEYLVKTGFPHVIIGRPPFSNTACWIDINNHVSGHLAAKYLNECGYRRVAFLGGPREDEISRHRLHGFLSSMRLFRLEVEDSYVKYGSYSRESGFHMMEELLTVTPLADAVICEDNKIAMGAVSAIRRHGMSIPRDMGIITFDDYPLSQLIDPPLTVVDIDVNSMGKQAAEILLKRLRTPSLNVQSFTTNPELIVRSSTRNLQAPQA